MKPNLLIFMTDQQQAATVDPGHPCLTPNFDRLATEGMRFTRAYTPAALCGPARACLMTSLYPHRNGMRNNPHVDQSIRTDVPADMPMFSNQLKAAGYRLEYCGKWGVSHGGPGAAGRGWEVPDEATQKKLWEPWPGRDAKLTRNFTLDRPGYDPYLMYGEVTDGPEAFPELRWTRYAADRLKELGKSDQPWCLFVGLHGPHDPYLAPENHLRRYDPATIPRPVSFTDTLIDKPAVYRRMRSELWGKLAWEHYAAATATFWAYISFIDELFGELMAALDATGQKDRTLVTTFTDHGEMMGAHGLFFKGVMAFEECYRIPLIARLPGRIAPGSVCHEFATLLDLGPTFAELAGAAPLSESHGRSLAPLLEGRTPADWPQEFFGQFHGSELLYSQRILTTKRYKYVFNGFDFDEIYDLEKDPHELVNLYHAGARHTLLPDLVARMWRRALAVGDTISSHAYPTTDLVPIGPNLLEP